MKLWQWMTATSISGIMMGIAIITFFQSVVYSRAQGQAVEVRMNQLEMRLTNNERAQRDDLSHIRDKIDEIYQILTHRKNE